MSLYNKVLMAREHAFFKSYKTDKLVPNVIIIDDHIAHIKYHCRLLWRVDLWHVLVPHIYKHIKMHNQRRYLGVPVISVEDVINCQQNKD